MAVYPAHGLQDWDDDLKTYIDAGDTAGGSYASTHLVRYVDYVNGLDANSGLAPMLAKKTIQAAYDDLQTVSGATYTAWLTGMLPVGRIILMPGDHDVGSGFQGDYLSPVEIVGMHGGSGNQPTNATSRVVSSLSPGPAELFRFGSVASATELCRGNYVRDVSFMVTLATNTALTACIRAQQNPFLHIQGCIFSTHNGQGSTDAYAIEQSSGAGNVDNAWMRILNNRSTRFGLYRATGGTNYNRGTIDSNLCFWDGGPSARAMIWLESDVLGCTVSSNNLEGTAVAIRLTSNSADKNFFINNAGEDMGGGTPTFYDFAGSQQQNIVIGGNCSSTGVIGTWITFGTNAHSNTVIGNCDFVGVTGFKQKIVDNSTLKNVYINPNGARVPVKSGAGVSTTSDADASFGFGTPMDGQQRILHNTSDGVSRIATRINATWKYVTVA